MLEIKFSGFDPRRWQRAGILFIGFLLALYVGYVVREIWLPMMIAFLIAMVLDPLVDKMESRGWSRFKSAALIYVLFFTMLGTVLTFAVPSIVNQTTTITKDLGQYLPSDDSKGGETETKKRLKRLLNRVHAAPAVENTVMRASGQISAAFGRSGGWFGKMAESAVSNLLWVVIIPLVSFYALKDLHLIYARLLMIIPRDYRVTAQNLLNEVSAIFVRYLRGLMIVCALNGVATFLFLTAFGVPNAAGLGAISGALYMVPYIGAALTILLVGGVCLMAGKSVLLIVGLMILLHHVFFDQIVTPRVVGSHVGLHPILSIIALLMGASLLGIPGMILAVPIAATVQMVMVAVFPKLARPIDVPSGEVLHQKVDSAFGEEQPKDELAQVNVVHNTIVAAVDEAEDADLPLATPAVLPSSGSTVFAGTPSVEKG